MHQKVLVESDGYDKAILHIREKSLKIIICRITLKTLHYKKIPKPTSFVWDERLIVDEIGLMPVKRDNREDLNIYWKPSNPEVRVSYYWQLPIKNIPYFTNSTTNTTPN